MMATQCYCSLTVGLRTVLLTDPYLAVRLPYSQDNSLNRFWVEGLVPERAPAPYLTMITLGRPNIQHDSDGMRSAENIRIRVYDTREALDIASRIVDVLRDSCICVGDDYPTNNCCFKLVSMQETVIGLATLAEIVFSTIWTKPH